MKDESNSRCAAAACLAPTAENGFVGHNAQQERIALNYSQLLERVDLIANQLQRLSANCIALRAQNSVDWVALDLAAMWSHIVMVPVPTFLHQNKSLIY